MEIGPNRTLDKNYRRLIKRNQSKIRPKLTSTLSLSPSSLSVSPEPGKEAEPQAQAGISKEYTEVPLDSLNLKAQEELLSSRHSGEGHGRTTYSGRGRLPGCVASLSPLPSFSRSVRLATAPLSTVQSHQLACAATFPGLSME